MMWLPVANPCSYLRLAAPLCAALLASACVAAPRAVPNGPPAFRQAYRVGCQTGREAGHREQSGVPGSVVYRDAQRFADDAQYRRGWQMGYRKCFAHARRYPRFLDAQRTGWGTGTPAAKARKGSAAAGPGAPTRK